MKIFITGVAGFVAFNFANELLKNKKIKVYGIDNLNSYYSIKLKKNRLKELKKKKNFFFIKANLTKKEEIHKIFKQHKFNEVYNFAAQAGVRYSIENPTQYIDNNVMGFSNLLDLSRVFKVNKFFYASSSSVYGDNKKFPLNENEIAKPKNIYGLSKKFNEEIAKSFYEVYGYKTIGLRFFTLFGEWGRPDMFFIKLLSASFNKKKFYLNNKGNHVRDFTYIKDVVSILLKLRKAKIENNEIYNICSNKPQGLKKIIKYISNYIPKTKIVLCKKQIADMYKTHGDNRKILKKIPGFKFTDINASLLKTIYWFKKNKNLFS
jgi:UDP-glucuronate 4-epimerase